MPKTSELVVLPKSLRYGWFLIVGIAISAAAAVGILVGVLLTRLDVLCFSGTIAAGNILQATATVCSALLVVLYLQRVVAADRKEKELVWKQFELLLELISEFERLLPAEERDLIVVTRQLKKLSQKSSFIAEIVNQCGFSSSVISAADFSENVKAIRSLTTDTPIKRITDFVQGAEVESVVRQGIISWANDRKREIDVELEKLKKAVFLAQIEVNKV